MLEACDLEMIRAVSRLDLPARYEVILVPEGQPRTKPRALNMGLDFARGAYVVVYDAEDRPDPGQLRAAIRRFDSASGRGGLPPGAAFDRPCRRDLADPHVRDRVCGPVPRGETRTRGLGTADPARRNVEPLSRRGPAPGRRLGRLERHRGHRPRLSTGPVRAQGPVARLFDLRGGAAHPGPLDAAAQPLAQGLDGDPDGARPATPAGRSATLAGATGRPSQYRCWARSRAVCSDRRCCCGRSSKAFGACCSGPKRPSGGCSWPRAPRCWSAASWPPSCRTGSGSSVSAASTSRSGSSPCRSICCSCRRPRGAPCSRSGGVPTRGTRPSTGLARRRR